ncbi:MAG: hypothetical protein KDD53_10030, partial [Bdellovibrionales bacterium]|nr:hypothetical protein [Bdellovibrionales bacterium]
PLEIELRANGRRVGAELGIARGDVHDSYPEYPYSITSGFQLELPSEIFSVNYPLDLQVVAKGEDFSTVLWQKTYGLSREFFVESEQSKAGSSALIDQSLIAANEIFEQYLSEKSKFNFQTQARPLKAKYRVHVLLESFLGGVALKEAFQAASSLLSIKSEDWSVGSFHIVTDKPEQLEPAKRVLAETKGVDYTTFAASQWSTSSFRQTDSEDEINLVFRLTDLVRYDCFNPLAFLKNYISTPGVSVLAPVITGQGTSTPVPSGIPLERYLAGNPNRRLLKVSDVPEIWIAPLKAVGAASYSLANPMLIERGCSVFLDCSHYAIARSRLDSRLSKSEIGRLEILLQEAAPNWQCLADRTALIVISSDWRSGDASHGWRAQVVELARSLKGQGVEVIFVDAQKGGVAPYVQGFATIKFLDFDTARFRSKAVWAIATDSESVKVANALRYLSDAKVASFFQRDETRISSLFYPERVSEVNWSLNGTTVAIVNSEWTKGKLSANRVSSPLVLDTFSSEAFFVPEIELKKNQVVILFDD